MPEAFTGQLADSDLGAVRGDRHTDSRNLSARIGRPAATLSSAVPAAPPPA